MANISVVVQDANNIQLNLTPAPATTLIAEGGNNVTLELTPTPTQVIELDRGVAGNGIESITVVNIDGSEYLRIAFTNGTTSDVGPISTTLYLGVSPIVVTGNQISLSTVPLTLGGTGATTAEAARANLGLGTIATQNANAVAITGGSISGSTLSGDTVGGANPYLDFADGTTVALSAGRMWYNGTTGSLNFGMGGGNITQQVGEELFIYGKASAAVAEGQLICKTGAVGASGVITFGPSPTGLTTNDGIIGVATENIALNGFGRITSFGIVRGINTTGSSVGETWLDNDTLYYNPNYAGGLTKVKPSAPYAKFEVGTVINASSGGSGSIQVDLIHGSTLGGTDSNVQINGVSNGNTLIYDATAGYWKNASITAGTGISVTNGAGSISVANTGVTSISGGTTGLTPSTATTGAVTFAGTLAVANGGTGATTASAALTSLGAYPSSNPSGYTSNTGTVTSVGMTVPTGLSISGTPVTTSGTFALTLTVGYSIPTTSSQTNWDSAYTQRLQWDGGSTNLVAATGRTSLGATTVGGNMFTLTNPSAITFPRFNADNTISALDAATFRTAIGAGTSSTTGTVTSVSGTGTVSGLSLSGNVTSSGNLTLGGTLDLSSPPAIGATSPNTGKFTTLTSTSDASLNGLTVGRGAGSVATNTAVGASALATNAGNGAALTAFGINALAQGSSGNYNTAIGRNTLSVMTSGASNIAVGEGALNATTSGSYNVAVGHAALVSNTTASNNTAVGYQSMYSNTTGNGTAVGQFALQNNTTGYGNTAVGGYDPSTSYQAALRSNTTGVRNNAFGNGALTANSTANDNNAFGVLALASNTTGANNTAIGNSALYSNTTASYNTAVGYQAGYSNTTGRNSTIGAFAGYSITTGTFNTLIGDSAGYNISTGSKNTVLGTYNGNQGGLDIRTASNYIVLSDGDGNPRGFFDGSGNYMVGSTDASAPTQGFAWNINSGGSFGRIGHASGTGSGTAYLAFQYAGSVIGTVTQAGTTGVLYNITSDYRLKTVFGNVSGAGERIDALQPIDYEWKSDGSRTRGFLAHKFQEVYPNSVSGEKDAVDAEGKPVYQTMQASTSEVIADLVAEIQALRKRLAAAGI